MEIKVFVLPLFSQMTNIMKAQDTAHTEYREKTVGVGFEGNIFVNGTKKATVEGRTTKSVERKAKEWCKRNNVIYA